MFSDFFLRVCPGFGSYFVSLKSPLGISLTSHRGVIPRVETPKINHTIVITLSKTMAIWDGSTTAIMALLFVQVAKKEDTFWLYP